MKLFLTTIKKTVAGVVQAANFLPSVTPAVKLSSLLTALSAQTPGLALNPVLTGTVPETPALKLTQLVSGTGQPTQAPAPALFSILNTVGGSSEQDTPAPKVVRTKFDLTHTAGATGSTSTGTWTNAANAQGKHNGTNATNANTVTAAASGDLFLTYAAQTGRTPMKILSVTLNWYMKYVPGLTTPCNVSYQYSLNGGSSYTSLVSNSAAAFDYSVTPRSDDITAAVGGDWSKIANLKADISLVGALSATVSTLTVDAVEVVVTAIGQNLYDTFVRADNASSIGTADSGQSWVNESGTWGISSNHAQKTGGTGIGASNSMMASIDAGIYDCRYVVNHTVSNSGGIAIRMLGGGEDCAYRVRADVTNNAYYASYVVGGVESFIGTVVSGGVTAGAHVLELEASGSTVKFYLDGALKHTYTIPGSQPQFLTATRVGIWSTYGDFGAFNSVSAYPV